MGKVRDQLSFELRPIAAGNDGYFDDAEKVAQKRRHFRIKRRFAFSNCTVQVENNQLFHCCSAGALSSTFVSSFNSLSAPKPRTRMTDRAIMSSSSVRMTRTA